MGYNTKFEGVMTLTPPLTLAQKREINEFCEARHGGNLEVYQGFPGFWCNWKADGQFLHWSGTEKSYDMDMWLQQLINRFFKPWDVKVSGKMLAQGEEHSDRWTMEVGEGQMVTVKRTDFQDLGITYR